MKQGVSVGVSARYDISHETLYQYSGVASGARQVAHLTPRVTAWQTLTAHALEILPAANEQAEDDDYFGNPVTRFAVEGPFNEQRIIARSRVQVNSRAPAADARTPDWRAVRGQLAAGSAETRYALTQFCAESPMAPVLAEAYDYARVTFNGARRWLTAMLELTTRIHEEFKFDASATTVTTPVDEVLAHKHGVCQDFAHLMISCLRSCGLAARYVSGYIVTTPPPGQPRLLGADASHAWVSCWCPGLGWVDFDPTNGKLVDTEFITLAWGREFADVTPLRGVVMGSGEQQLEVRVSVTPVSEDADAAA